VAEAGPADAMAEHIARGAYYVQVHLLYASIVWLAALALTSIGPGSATAKYWIWTATSLNFVTPLGAVADAAWSTHLTWARPLAAFGALGVGISRYAAVVAALWLLGAGLMGVRLLARIRAERRGGCLAERHGTRGPRGNGRLVDDIPVRFCGRATPAVDGILRPCISLPYGIEQVLSDRELDAVLLHELTHAKRRDNLWRLVHEAVLCLLWFHPLVWMTGGRLALYRELSCDEPVIARARGCDLVAALAKLAAPEGALLLRATVSSPIADRLARLTRDAAGRRGLGADALIAALFACVLLACVLGTVAHTACCFV
jgi:beta-lactamase regulating signal transducer with metallopeptidase domain